MDDPPPKSDFQGQAGHLAPLMTSYFIYIFWAHGEVSDLSLIPRLWEFVSLSSLLLHLP